jgi:hypothetical protein
MLMVCPNCHSKQIVEIQDQRFCINCGQMVPDSKGKVGTGGLKVQQNGLPEGVKILGKNGPDTLASVAPETSAKATPEPAKVTPKPAPEPPTNTAAKSSFVRARHRIAGIPKPGPGKADAEAEAATTPDATTPDSTAAATIATTTATDTPATPKPRKRKPGRPKAGRLDIPKPIKTVAQTAPPEPPAPTETPTTTLADAKPSTTKPAETKPTESKPAVTRPMTDIAPPTPKRPPAPPHHVHRVGIAPLHFGSIIAFSLRARLHRHQLALGALAALVLAALGGVGAWLFLTGQLPSVARRLLAFEPRIVSQLMLLGLLYYIGRSIAGAAIVYGVSREADHRPVGLGAQLGVAINTFGRRLGLDLVFGAAQLSLAAAVVLLIITGGTPWTVSDITIHPQAQLALLFGAFLVLLYLMTAAALSHGLAAVALVLTKQHSTAAAKLGWQLFSHRFELLGWRFLSLTLELALAIPLIAAAVAMILYVPSEYILATSLGVGLIAWIAGALVGAGTASWWAALYRKIVLLDHPNGASNLLSARQPLEADRLMLTAIVAISTTAAFGCIVIPWLKLSS